MKNLVTGLIPAPPTASVDEHYRRRPRRNPAIGQVNIQIVGVAAWGLILNVAVHLGGMDRWREPTQWDKETQNNASE
jgi:hypothetical protein